MKYIDFINIQEEKSPYIIAEAGVNHEGSMDLAKRLIDEAAEGGADAIKFQSYKAETLASKNSPSYWSLEKESTTSQFELFKKYDNFWKNEYEELKLYCDQAGIEFCSTPFDSESADYLNDLMSFYKISSSDITNKPFIEQISSYGKPIILSTGASEHTEIKSALSWINNITDDINVALLHCILNYPTPNKNANLRMIIDLCKEYPKNIIGYSDHTLPEEMLSLYTATIYGALVLEKHFTHDKTLPGNDHYHAMDKNDLKLFKNMLEKLNLISGSKEKKCIPEELISKKNARRSIVANCLINKGDTITREMITFKRPGTGIKPFEIDGILGKKASIEIAEDTILEQEMIAD